MELNLIKMNINAYEAKKIKYNEHQKQTFKPKKNKY